MLLLLLLVLLHLLLLKLLLIHLTVLLLVVSLLTLSVLGAATAVLVANSAGEVEVATTDSVVLVGETAAFLELALALEVEAAQGVALPFALGLKSTTDEGLLATRATPEWTTHHRTALEPSTATAAAEATSEVATALVDGLTGKALLTVAAIITRLLRVATLRVHGWWVGLRVTTLLGVGLRVPALLGVGLGLGVLLGVATLLVDLLARNSLNNLLHVLCEGDFTFSLVSLFFFFGFGRPKLATMETKRKEGECITF